MIPPLIGTVLAGVSAGDEGAATGVLLTATQAANALGVALTLAAWTAVRAHGAVDGFAAGMGVAIVLLILTAFAAIRLAGTQRTADSGGRRSPHG